MRVILFSLIILFSVAHNAKAQNWSLVNSNTMNDIIDISFKDDSIGFFLTNSGKLFYSQDSGNNWSLVHQDTSLISGQIAVTNDSIFWYALDINGTPMKSKSLLSTFIFTKDTIDILPIRPIFWQNEIWDVHKVNQFISVEEFAVSDNYIWATSESKIFKSDDIGNTWQEHHFFTGFSSGPYQSYYNGTNNMIAITQYPTNIHSTTDGNNWIQYATLPNALCFYFVNSNNFLAYNLFGLTSKIYKTSDGGQSFTSENLVDTPTGLYSKYNNNKTIFIYGKNGMLYKSTNSGGLLSTDVVTQKSDFKIYPNPAYEEINLKYPNTLKIESITLMDSQGKIVNKFQNNFETLNIRGISSGNYMLLIRSKDGNSVQKFIVK